MQFAAYGLYILAIVACYILIFVWVLRPAEQETRVTVRLSIWIVSVMVISLLVMLQYG